MSCRRCEMYWLLGVTLGGALLLLALSSLGCAEPAQPRPAKLPPAAAPAVQQPRPAIPEFPNGPPMGYQPDREGTKAFLKSLDKPHLRDAGPELFQEGPGGKQSVLLYRALEKTYKETYGEPWRCGTQGIGDCVSWGWMHGIAIATAVEYRLGNVSTWKLPATEAIYGGSRVEALGKARAGRQDGSYGGAAAKWVHDKGGVLFRQPYDKFDLTKYSAQRAKDWGDYGCGGAGDDGWADRLAREHPVNRVALVRSFAEAAAAIDSGYPVPVCSNQGFVNVRDQDGFAKAQGSWGHCMCFIAVRYDRPGLLCLNSWGTTWISGPKHPADQPDGSFWVESKVCDRMLELEDSFAVSAVQGFPKRRLDNGDWVQLTPPQVSPADQAYALAP